MSQPTNGQSGVWYTSWRITITPEIVFTTNMSAQELVVRR